MLASSGFAVLFSNFSVQVLLELGDASICLPMFTERALFEQSEYNWQHNALGVEMGTSRIVEIAQKLQQNKEVSTKMFCLLLNPSRNQGYRSLVFGSLC